MFRIFDGKQTTMYMSVNTRLLTGSIKQKLIWLKKEDMQTCNFQILIYLAKFLLIYQSTCTQYLIMFHINTFLQDIIYKILLTIVQPKYGMEIKLIQT